MTTNIADAFDLVGKRWALRVVRELALGPQRYTDLRRRLAGISTNVLAARLLELQQAEVARRRLLPPPAGSAVFRVVLDADQLAPLEGPDASRAGNLAGGSQQSGNADTWRAPRTSGHCAAGS